MKKINLLNIFFLLPLILFSQQIPSSKSNSKQREIINKYLTGKKEIWKLTDEDIKNWDISNTSSNKEKNITYLYLHQKVNGIRIFNAVSSVSIKDDQVKSFAKRLYSDAVSKTNTDKPVLTVAVAIQKAAEHLSLKLEGQPKLISTKKALNRFYYSPCGISSENIRVDLVYQPVKSSLRLAWDVNIHLKDKSHWWNIRIDAVTGEFIQKNDWVAHCDFGAPSGSSVNSTASTFANGNSINQAASLASYRVFALPIESPSFGASTLIPDPSDAVASPFGWHDTDGNPGPEFTTTRGNNVHAYDDIANQNAPGTSPNGGSNLLFDFPANLTQPASSYLSASLTNLFYLNNMMHDMLYRNGFDEESGNFQQTNYTGQGLGQDYVFAECQDGGGTNNANFGTPDDGQNPTMQMYLWTSPVQSTFTVNSPGSIAGNYQAVAAGFGPGVVSPITADLAIADDGTGTISDACEPIVNGTALSGKIVLIDRGICNFVDKVLAAQNQGALAVLIINNSAGSIFSMGDNGNGGSVTIPSEMISLTDGTMLKNSINGGATVNATLTPPPSTAVDLDGSLDNGIVIHEFGHGVSNRLTGGPSNSNCLGNGEQAGEGWSDFFALLFTIRPGDVGTAARGMGTYALGQPNSGGGIRRYPYSTNMSINPETYSFLAQSPETHDVGEVWCTVLWDLNWAMIDQFGFDANWFQGTSGNNITLKLVLEGMKLQPCGPGFLDSRDAILAADDNLYNGIHKCLIWETFARRGMGYSAVQGDPEVAGDETEAFDLPPACLIPTSAPTANFTANITTSCFGTIRFNDLSTNIAQSWKWDFGDGDTSNLQNPIHNYTAPGNYTVTLKVFNTLGSDSLIKNQYISITAPAAPGITGDTSICSGTSTSITANVLSGNVADWYDSTNAIIFTGTVFNTPSLNANTTYRVTQHPQTVIQHVGPVNNSFNTGGYHNSGFEGKLLFTTFAPVRIKSVWVDASGTANRTFNLYGSTGSLIQSITINVASGQGTVPLNFDIQTPGNYSIGASTFSNLYRNNAGASYPYNVNGLISITGSNSTTNPATFYYYLYDWEVQELPCTSFPYPVTVFISEPVSSFTYNPTGLNVVFTNTSVSNIVSQNWDFGNGSNSTQPNPTVNYSTAGTYTVTLTVTNADGCQDVSSQTITVQNVGIQDLTDKPIHIFNDGNTVFVKFNNTPVNARIRIFDAIGKLLTNDLINDEKIFSHNLQNIYSNFITVFVEVGENSFTKKIIILN